MGDTQIRELRREDFWLVRNLYAATKSRLRREAYDRWCLFDTPWGDAISIVAMDGDICAGLFVLRPAMLNLGGVDVLGAQATDLMTHPDYRRRGLFVAMVEESFKIASSRGYEAIYAFPNEQGKSYPGFVHRLNFDHVGDVASWVYELNSFRLQLPFLSSPFNARLVQGMDDIGPDELGALIQISKEGQGICRIKRDQRWLEWRYAKASAEIYRWYTARDSSGKIQGAILVGERDDSWVVANKGELRIHEAFASTREVLVTLLKSLIQNVSKQSWSMVKILTKDGLIESALGKIGFKRSGHLPLVVRKLNGRTLMGNIHDFAAWRIMSGDVDVY